MRRYACLIPLAASFSRSKDSSLMMCSILQALASATSGSTPAAISCSVKNKGEILIHLERSMIELWILSSFSGAVNAVASSKITMGASFRMQRTIEMRCFSPPERVAPPVSTAVQSHIDGSAYRRRKKILVSACRKHPDNA